MAKNKKFRLVDAILSVITVVFVAEAAAPAAAIGNSQFFWWIFLIIAFLLPYGLVVSDVSKHTGFPHSEIAGYNGSYHLTDASVKPSTGHPLRTIYSSKSLPSDKCKLFHPAN